MVQEQRGQTGPACVSEAWMKLFDNGEVTGIAGMIQRQVIRTPDAIACIDHLGKDAGRSRQRQLTYAALALAAARLAHQLREKGVQREVSVATFMGRSLEQVVAQLAIFQAGGIYIPIDPTNPRERIDVLFEQAAPHLIITNDQWQNSLPETNASVVALDWDALQAGDEQAGAAIPPETTIEAVLPQQSAYVIFTSGSTGKPKGVEIEMAALVNLCRWYGETCELGPQSIMMQAFSVGFDASIKNVLAPLACGGTVVLFREGAFHPADLLEHMRAHQVTHINTVPSIFHLVLEQAAANDYRDLASLKFLVSGGEPLNPERFSPWLVSPHCHCKVLNVYGPTETADSSLVFTLPAQQGLPAVVPIGKPIPYTQAYIVDDQLNEVIGSGSGELAIAGIGLARGYRGRADLTAERFVPNPFGNGDRLYLTGDAVRREPDGQITFLGRLDRQLKIRGFRIEPGEIEKVLESHADVRQAVVRSSDSTAGARLIAYVTLRDEVYESARNELVKRWGQISDAIYRETPKEIDTQLNTLGWNDSYTGQPIPEGEMLEWVEATVARILHFRPRRVLEIGCGTGMLLSRIAPHCEHYTATDVSREALAYIEAQLAGKAHASRVELRHLAAHQIGSLGESAAYDMVIINSVVQHFPSVGYLIEVLDTVLTRVEEGGFVFVGDVRDLRLLEAFQTSVESVRAPASLSVAELRRRIRDAIAKEQELCVAPDFFAALQRDRPIDLVRIQLKRGQSFNELNRFRYDALLRVGESLRVGNASATWPVTERLDWRDDRLDLETVRQHLTLRQPETLAIANVPNARLTSAYRQMELLRQEPPFDSTAAFRDAVNSLAAEGVPPERWWQWESEIPYTVTVHWPDAQRNRYEVVFQRGDRLRPAGIPSQPSPFAQATPLRCYANNPIRPQIAATIESRLRHALKARLPDYMRPASIVLLDELPLLPSGKLDLKALPDVGGERPELDVPFTTPNTELERKVAEVWKRVLRLDKVGVHDPFFDLGGDSLRLVQVHTELLELFGKAFTIMDLFRHPTIFALVKGFGPRTEPPTLSEPTPEPRQTRNKLLEQARRRRSSRSD